MTINQAKAILRFIKRLQRLKRPDGEIVFALANEFNLKEAVCAEKSYAGTETF